MNENLSFLKKKNKVAKILNLTRQIETIAHELRLIDNDEKVIIGKIEEMNNNIATQGVASLLKPKLYSAIQDLREDRYDDIIKIYENGTEESETD